MLVMPSRTLGGWIALGIGLLSALRVALLWDRLPERLASHYGPSGQPNGFMMRGDFFVFYFGLFAFVVGLFWAMPLVLKGVPRELVNIPHRDYWTTDERWPEAVELLGRWMAWFGVAMTVFAASVLHLVLRSNLTQMPLDNTLMVTFLGIFFAFTAYWLVVLYRAFRPPSES